MMIILLNQLVVVYLICAPIDSPKFVFSTVSWLHLDPAMENTNDSSYYAIGFAIV